MNGANMRKFSYAPRAAPCAPPAFGEALGRMLARLAGSFRAMARERARRRRVRETVDVLMALDARQLRDIGLSRTEILSAVYGEPRDRRIDIRFDD
jgi:uncharacterized protein YjiS (DUF1127 family)